MHTYIALLRAINVSGRNKIEMAELRSLCTSLGWSEVRSYIQSGNLVFKAAGNSQELEAALEEAIQGRFGLSVPVVIRTAAAWKGYVESNPFPETSREEPGAVALALSKSPPHPDAARMLQERAKSGERVAQVGDALWIHYSSGVAGSKLTPALLDRLAGSPVTARNWRTVLKLAEMAHSSESRPGVAESITIRGTRRRQRAQ